MISNLSIPSAVSTSEARLMKEMCSGLIVVECGALLGASTVTLAQVAKTVISIDKHEGYGPSTWEKYQTNLQRFKVNNNVVPIKADVFNVLPHLKGDRWFVDLDGTFETTSKVLRMLPFNTPILIHDFGRVNCRGVEKAIIETGCTIEQVVDTLAVVRR